LSFPETETLSPVWDYLWISLRASFIWLLKNFMLKFFKKSKKQRRGM